MDLSAFFRVHPSFFSYLPVGSLILISFPSKRIVENEDEKQYSKRVPMFVRKHNETSFNIANQPYGKEGDYEYKSLDIKYTDDVIIYKKYAIQTIIEMRLIHNSLIEKDERIRDLERSNIELTERINAIEKTLYRMKNNINSF